MPTIPKVFLVEDHPMFAGLLAELLTKSGEFEVVGTTGDGAAALEVIKTKKIDILLVDLELSGMSGLEVISAVRAFDSSIKVAIMSGICTDRVIAEGFTLGVAAFLEKSLETGAFLQAMREVVTGKLSLSTRVSNVLQRMVRHSVRCKPLAAIDLQVLRMLAQQVPIKEIAQQIGVSLSTVYKARDRILARTGVENNWAALHNLAAEYALVQPEIPGHGPTSAKSRASPAGLTAVS